jgi:hypothetical protein
LSGEEKYRYDKSRLEFIKLWKPALVIICVRWDQSQAAHWTDLLLFLEEYASNVLLIEQPPVLGIGDRNAMQYLCYKHIRPEPGVKRYLPISEETRSEYGRSLVRSLSREYKNCGVLATHDLYCNESEALVLDGKNIVYLDDDHLVTYGARLAIPRLEQAIVGAFRKVRGDQAE